MRAVELFLRSVVFLREHWKLLGCLTLAAALIRAVLRGIGFGLPGLAVSGFDLASHPVEAFYLLGLGGLFAVASQVLLYVLLQVVVTSFATSRADGEGGGILDAFLHGVPLLGRCAATVVVPGLVTAAVSWVGAVLWVPVVFPLMRLCDAAGISPEHGRPLLLLAMFALQAPALYLLLGFLLAVPVATIEDREPRQAIARAWRMVSARRLHALLAVAPGLLLAWLFSVVVDELFFAMLQAFGSPASLLRFLRWVLVSLSGVLAEAWLLASVALLYLDLRGEDPARAPAGRMLPMAEA